MKFEQHNLSSKDRSRLEQAKRIAATSTCGYKHGAVAVNGGRVVGVGVNSYKNVKELYDIIPYPASSTHAEQACLRAIGVNAKGATLYVARVSRSGEERMSKPCQMCQKALRDAGVRRVVYTIDSSMELNN